MENYTVHLSYQRTCNVNNGSDRLSNKLVQNGTPLEPGDMLRINRQNHIKHFQSFLVFFLCLKAVRNVDVCLDASWMCMYRFAIVDSTADNF
jgi:hypothetical protein